jgi:ribonuclease P protein component
VLRDAFRHARGELPGGDYVLIAQPGSRNLDNAALRAEFLQLLTRVRALKAVPPPGTMPASPEGIAPPASDP